jgi:hypothetical protein
MLTYLSSDFRDVLAIENPNPLVATFTIPAISEPSTIDAIPLKRHTLERIGMYIQGVLLMAEYRAIPEDHCSSLFKSLAESNATLSLNRQIGAYTRRSYPFNGPLGNRTPLEWWSHLLRHSDAAILAVSQ